MQETHPFRPLTNAVAISGTTSNQTVNIPGVGNVLLFVNTAAAAALVAYGLATADSTTNYQFVIGAGESRCIMIGRDQYIGIKLATGTGTVYVTRGDGGV